MDEVELDLERGRGVLSMVSISLTSGKAGSGAIGGGEVDVARFLLVVLIDFVSERCESLLFSNINSCFSGEVPKISASNVSLTTAG